MDPEHTSCIGGRTVLTCRNCAGNAPRGAICSCCGGRGFNIFVCTHCNPESATASVRSTPSSLLVNTPDSSAPASPASLSRSSSTVSSYHDPKQIATWKRLGDGDESPSGGKIGTKANTSRNL
ncbi:hypothetical protein BO71DRAFT_205301 [Aspergillus ellipticus CBS 707.79]|uniref:Uncharacterized protein n=1 Tax=Aspergillus ellipticus CBS 707.79 TaxID=1448320 RepID=A0A319DD99_9EURO|nr:hypothetical protein BO71DRAFT_205301 [Aspergillus ellipticus CBS 707.79]